MSLARSLSLLAAVVAVLSLVGARAQQRPRPLALPPALEDRAREIGLGLRCPICQGESIATSPSDLAAQMMNVVRQKVGAGQDRATIEAYFVARYGEWILLDPPRRGINLVLWLGPLAAFAAGAGGLARFLRRATARPDAVALDPADLERVRRDAPPRRPPGRVEP